MYGKELLSSALYIPNGETPLRLGGELIGSGREGLIAGRKGKWYSRDDCLGRSSLGAEGQYATGSNPRHDCPGAYSLKLFVIHKCSLICWEIELCLQLRQSF